MNIPLYIQQRVSELTSVCDQQLKTVWLWITVALGFVCGIIYVNSPSPVLDHSLAALPYIVLALGLLAVVILVINSLRQTRYNDLGVVLREIGFPYFAAQSR